jgi:hypothetical protein
MIETTSLIMYNTDISNFDTVQIRTDINIVLSHVFLFSRTLLCCSLKLGDTCLA